jgi:hypothetical protein
MMDDKIKCDLKINKLKFLVEMTCVVEMGCVGILFIDTFG